MKNWTKVGLCLGVLALFAPGCNKGSGSVENASRTDQEKAFKGDPKKGEEMLAKMREKYGNQTGPKTP